MTIRRWSGILLLVAGCGGSTESMDPASVADAVANYSGGAIGFTELEEAFPEARTPACVAARRARGGGSIEELTPCYRELAEDLVLERLVLSEIEDVAQSVRELQNYGDLRRHAYLEVFNRRLADEIEISDKAVEDHYEANREDYRRPGSLNLWNIFRRHEDPSKPEETLEFLRKLKKRYEAGETFASLARAHSQSETRLRDGSVGQVTEGRLPARLEKAAFALGDGDVSEPIPVRGGAVLLHVRNVVRAVDLTLEDVERRIRQDLRALASTERIKERVAGVQAPADAVLLDPDELIEALDSGDAEAVVMNIDGDRLTVGQARQIAGLAAGASPAELDETARERLAVVYEERRTRGLLALDLLANADPDLRSEAEEHLADQAVAALVDDRLRREMETSTVVDDASLETYFRDNVSHYQSPLRFHLHLWNLPFGSDPPRQLERMEELREELASGEMTLEAAAGELGGTVRDLGLKELSELPEITGKARQYLLQTTTGDFSVPYQDGEALHMLWVEAHEEPRVLSYDEAAERVRADYLERFEEQLFRQTAEQRLAAAGFFFDDEAVRRVLVPAD